MSAAVLNSPSWLFVSRTEDFRRAGSADALLPRRAGHACAAFAHAQWLTVRMYLVSIKNSGAVM